MLERDIEEYLVNRVIANGGEIRKVKWIARRGAPDRRVLLPGTTPCWVELKAPGGKLEEHQEREHTRMERFGEEIYVIDTLAKVDAFMSMKAIF